MRAFVVFTLVAAATAAPGQYLAGAPAAAIGYAAAPAHVGYAAAGPAIAQTVPAGPAVAHVAESYHAGEFPLQRNCGNTFSHPWLHATRPMPLLTASQANMAKMKQSKDTIT